MKMNLSQHAFVLYIVSPFILLGLLAAILFLCQKCRLLRSLDVLLLSILFAYVLDVTTNVIIADVIVTEVDNKEICHVYIWISLTLRIVRVSSLTCLSLDRMWIFCSSGGYTFKASPTVSLIVFSLWMISALIGFIPASGLSSFQTFDETDQCLFLPDELHRDLGITFFIFESSLSLISLIILSDALYSLKYTKNHMPFKPSKLKDFRRHRDIRSEMTLRRSCNVMAAAYDNCRVAVIVAAIMICFDHLPFAILSLYGVVIGSKTLYRRLVSIWLTMIAAILVPHCLWICNARYRAALKQLPAKLMCKNDSKGKGSDNGTARDLTAHLSKSANRSERSQDANPKFTDRTQHVYEFPRCITEPRVKSNTSQSGSLGPLSLTSELWLQRPLKPSTISFRSPVKTERPSSTGEKLRKCNQPNELSRGESSGVKLSNDDKGTVVKCPHIFNPYESKLYSNRKTDHKSTGEINKHNKGEEFEKQSVVKNCENCKFTSLAAVGFNDLSNKNLSTKGVTAKVEDNLINKNLHCDAVSLRIPEVSEITLPSGIYVSPTEENNPQAASEGAYFENSMTARDIGEKFNFNFGENPDECVSDGGSSVSTPTKRMKWLRDMRRKYLPAAFVENMIIEEKKVNSSPGFVGSPTHGNQIHHEDSNSREHKVEKHPFNDALFQYENPVFNPECYED